MTGRKLVLIITIFIGVSSCRDNTAKQDAVRAMSFNSQVWMKQDFKGRSDMVESLLGMKDSLLISKTPSKIERLLGQPDEETKENMVYFFEKKYGETVVLSHLIVRFDTLRNVCVDSWWTD